MKLPRSRSLPLAAACAVFASAPVQAADDAALRPIAFQNGVNQQSLGAETAELARAIDELINELQRNGFPVQSLAGLSELATQLNSLGGGEMTAIAARLRRLGENAQTDPRATAAEAYLAQQAIETRLKSLARQISIQQLREETARRLETLIARQVAIQRETRAIATTSADADRQRLLESDQNGIGEDLSSFFQTGENLLSRLRENTTTAAPGSTPAPAAGPSFSDRINGAYLNTLCGEAVEHLKSKRYPDAYARQGALIVELRKILLGILSSLPKEQRLANALQEVSALRQQEEARAKTETVTEESKQAAADQAQNLADQVAAISPEAAAELKEAAKEILETPTAPETPTPPTPPTPPEEKDKDKKKKKKEKGQEKESEKVVGKEASQTPTEKTSTTETPGKAKPEEEAAATKTPAEPPETGTEAKSPAAESLAKAEAALQKALTQAQAQAAAAKPQSPGQQQTGKEQQTAQGQQQQGQQQQNGQQQNQTAQQQNQNGQQQNDQQQNQNGQQQANNQSQGENQQQQDGNNANMDANESGGGYADSSKQLRGVGPNARGPAQVVGALRSEERDAFNALQNERYPAEYSAWVQQYWRNLAQEQ
jgi:Ca-activated chloride channel family protein